MICDGNLQVLNFSSFLEHIWQIGSHIQNILKLESEYLIYNSNIKFPNKRDVFIIIE